TRPVLLTEVAPLARYGHLATLAPWADLATRRGQAIWVLVPQLPGNYGPVIDGRPLPLAAPGQFLALDRKWIDGQACESAGDTSGQQPTRSPPTCNGRCSRWKTTCAPGSAPTPAARATGSGSTSRPWPRTAPPPRGSPGETTGSPRPPSRGCSPRCS